MKREIKFRGKRLDNGEWVYGFLADEDYINDINSIDLSSIEVDPATVSQYTGLKDCNGKEIYEGDIIKLDLFNHLLFVVDFVEGAFCLKNGDGYYTDINYIQHAGINQAELVGNIHDNPALLEGKK
ncbi:MAG: YopX family protein [Bacteroidales bacterium]|nr:YopX family protein [Bacteroidales bacterium]MDE7072476.1 YopX family protein [Bacteroidales bacterium]